MPFTFSHPAIVLPLTYLPKRWFSLTGLVIGSLTPDFEYFLRMRIESKYSHTLYGLFWFDLPLGLLLSFIFHTSVRNRLFDNLPTFFAARFSSFTSFDWNNYVKRNWVVVMVSLLIGAASHLFWDGFTHEHGYFVQVIPELRTTLDFLGYKVHLLKILQHSSTLIGGIVIGYSIYRLPVKKVESRKINPNYWIVFAGLTLAIIALRSANGLDLKHYGNVIVTALSAAMISLVITPWLVRKRGGFPNT